MYNYTIKVYLVAPFSSMALTPWTGVITFKKTLSLAKISTGIRITNEIGSGYGDISINYHSEDINEIIEGDIIKIFKWVTPIYYWIVRGKSISLSWTAVQYDIECKGFNVALNDYYYKSAWNTVFNKTQDPKAIIEDIITQSRQEVPYFSNTFTNIQTLGTNFNIDFDKVTLQEALKKVLAISSYYLALRADGVVYFEPYPVTATHNFEFKRDIRSIDFETNIDDLANDVTLIHGAGTSSNFDADSMYLYWSKEKIINDSEIKDNTTATQFINTYLNENAIRKDTIKVTVNTSYSIENIYPWQMINISNCPVEIKEKIIRRVEITDKGAILYLNTKQTLEKALLQLKNNS